MAAEALEGVRARALRVTARHCAMEQVTIIYFESFCSV